MPRKKPKFEYAIICDDIRQEVGNKTSLIGIYGREIFVSRFPFSFPKLCFAISFRDIKNEDTLSIKLIDPSGKQLKKTLNGTAPKEVKGYIKFQMFALFTPLVAEKEGLYKLVITINNDDKSKQEIGFTIKQHSKSK